MSRCGWTLLVLAAALCLGGLFIAGYVYNEFFVSLLKTVPVSVGNSPHHLDLSSVIQSTPNDVDERSSSAHSQLEHSSLQDIDINVLDSRTVTDVDASSTPCDWPIFQRKYKQVSAAAISHSNKVKENDRWSGPHPLCGIYHLYNLTKLRPYLSLPKLLSDTSAFRYTSQISMCPDGDQVRNCPDIYFSARLIGASVVHVQVSRNSSCSYSLQFTVFDPGYYTLEVRVVWIDGYGPEMSPPRHPVTLRKTHSKFGKKPHQSYVFNRHCEEQTLILNSPMKVVVPPLPFKQPKRRCSSIEDLAVPGRWVNNSNSELCAADSVVCSGNPSLLNDIKPFNHDLLWLPSTCHFHFWGRGEGPSTACVRRNGTLLLMGDSTAREYAQNLRMFNLKGTGFRIEYANWKLEWQHFGRRMASDSLRRLAVELNRQRPVILCINLGPLHLIAGVNTSEWDWYVDQWAYMIQKNNFSFIERKIFLGPAAIHYATNDMTAQRMLKWMNYAEQTLAPLGFEVLPAWSVTASRHESSWDGVHYAAERGKAQMKFVALKHKTPLFKWNGGVSMMLTTMLLNLLCTST